MIGPWTGSVVLTTGRRTAEALSRALLRGNAPEVLEEEDVVDAYGEIANVVGGSVKATLPGQSALGLPSVGAAPQIPNAADVCRLELLWRGEPVAISVQGALRWLWFGTVIAADLWDHDRGRVVVNRHVAIIREAGALSELPHVLDAVAHVHLMAGELAAAASVVQEGRIVCDATGTVQARLGPLGLAAMRGPAVVAVLLLRLRTRDLAARRDGEADGFLDRAQQLRFVARAERGQHRSGANRAG